MQKAYPSGSSSGAKTTAAGSDPSLPFVVVDAPQALPETLLAAQELLESLPVPVFFKDRAGNYLGVNKAWEEFFGIPREKFLGKRVQDLYPLSPEVAAKHHAMDEELWQHPGHQSYEITVAAQGGRMRDTIYYKATLHGDDGDVAGLIGTIVDISDRKQAESALRESEARFRLTFELAGSGIAHVGMDGRFLRVNRSLCNILGYSAEEFAARTVKDISHPDDRDVADAQRARLLSGELESTRLQKRFLRKDGATVWVDLTVALVRDAEGRTLYDIAVFDDDTERKNAESALRESEERFRSLTEVSSDWYWEQDENFRFTIVSRGIQDSIGVPPEALIGKRRWDAAVVGMSEADWAAHKATLEAHQPFQDLEYGRINASGRVSYLGASGKPVFDERGRFKGYRGVGRDITARKTAEAALRQAHDELARSNAELEQFAYVASHDLQEPLRMVSSYTQLLLRRYGERFDGDAKEFMDFIVDGAARMKQLIEDLLAYSRVRTRGREFRSVACEEVLGRVLVNLRAAIEASGATVTHDPLPTIEGDDSQLVQLFQNLIGNALKFRGAAAPQVHVGAIERDAEWDLCFRDNSIGIEPQSFERIFLVFQRLHDKGEYPGTGIGLAICKKVVDRHGGRIWVESKSGEGSTFRFTLPKHRGEKNE
jgi:PAS domain S-box-containing protein